MSCSVFIRNAASGCLAHVVALTLFTAVFPGPFRSEADTVEDREGAIREDRSKLESGTRWEYNDIEKGMEEARRSGRPLLVALRCVPCIACSGIDTEILLEGNELGSLLDEFVCVRLINVNALDLTRFQFDFDLSYSVLFLNADGTLYGRFGSWVHQKNAQENSTRSFRIAMEKALDSHRAYPSNSALLKGKQSTPLPWKTPTEMPELAGKYTPQLSWDTRLVQSCVHCHQIGDALRKNFRQTTGSIPSKWIYPNPSAETIGLTLSENEAAMVGSVVPGSAAAEAGLKAGDHIESVDGQMILSVADVRWALHELEDDQSRLVLGFRRDGELGTASVKLPEKWRSKDDISRRVGTWPMRAMALGGMKLVDLDDGERRKRGLPLDTMALLAQHVGQYGEHAVAKRAGLVAGDLILGMAGVTSRNSESAIIGHIIQNHKPGGEIPVTALRDGEIREFRFKAQ